MSEAITTGTLLDKIFNVSWGKRGKLKGRQLLKARNARFLLAHSKATRLPPTPPTQLEFDPHTEPTSLHVVSRPHKAADSITRVWGEVTGCHLSALLERTSRAWALGLEPISTSPQCLHVSYPGQWVTWEMNSNNVDDYQYRGKGMSLSVPARLFLHPPTKSRVFNITKTVIYILDVSVPVFIL